VRRAPAPRRGRAALRPACRRDPRFEQARGEAGNPKSAVYDLGPKATRNDFFAPPVVWQNRLYVGVGQDPEHGKGVGHLWCIDLTKKPANDDKDLSPVGDNFDPKAAVNKDSGLVWHYGGFIDPKPAKGRGYRFGRTLSTCAVQGGLLYAADFGGFFFCLDALTGTLYYEHDMKAETWASPLWVAGHVYIGNEDCQVLVFKDGWKRRWSTRLT
jgi:outer membrane protein assembly factor BamB